MDKQERISVEEKRDKLSLSLARAQMREDWDEATRLSKCLMHEHLPQMRQDVARIGEALDTDDLSLIDDLIARQGRIRGQAAYERAQENF